ncbi:hypothetical protein PG996_000290 [Apiospora saccharicola]|uniref:Uncharacterized protein n=1 Tax=Apiospora saccharicola TaxID=335842 RepID=A0ABR1WDC3_9PEZI
MLVPLILLTTLPLGIVGLAMPPQETAAPPNPNPNRRLQPRDAPPVVEVMTMTCLMPGDEETTTSDYDTPPTSWTSWTPEYSTLSWPSPSSSSLGDDCDPWEDDCSLSPTSTSTDYSDPWWSSTSTSTDYPEPWWSSSGFFTSSSSFAPEETSSSSSSMTCEEWDYLCSYTPAYSDSPSPIPSSTTCDDWDEFCSYTATYSDSSSSSSSSSTSAPYCELWWDPEVCTPQSIDASSSTDYDGFGSATLTGGVGIRRRGLLPSAAAVDGLLPLLLRCPPRRKGLLKADR